MLSIQSIKQNVGFNCFWCSVDQETTSDSSTVFTVNATETKLCDRQQFLLPKKTRIYPKQLKMCKMENRSCALCTTAFGFGNTNIQFCKSNCYNILCLLPKVPSRLVTLGGIAKLQQVHQLNLCESRNVLNHRHLFAKFDVKQNRSKSISWRVN